MRARDGVNKIGDIKERRNKKEKAVLNHRKDKNEMRLYNMSLTGTKFREATYRVNEKKHDNMVAAMESYESHKKDVQERTATKVRKERLMSEKHYRELNDSMNGDLVCQASY